MADTGWLLQRFDARQVGRNRKIGIIYKKT